MRIFKRISILVLPAIPLALIAIPAFADDCNGNPCPPTLLQGLSAIVPPIINIVLVIAGIVSFIMFVLNGFNFITALGDPEKIKSARKSLVFSILGFALLFFPFIIIPALVKLSGLNTAVTVSQNGTINTNIGSSFTPTPLPNNAINTVTITNTPFPSSPPTTTPQALCGSSPADCTKTILQYYNPSITTDNLDEYDPTGAYDIYNSGLHACALAAITANMNGYASYLLGKDDAFEIKDVLHYLASIGDFVTRSDGTGYTINDPPNFTVAANKASGIENLPITWNYQELEFGPDCNSRACLNQANAAALGAFEGTVKDVVDKGYPVIVTLYGWSHTEVIKQIIGSGPHATVITANSGDPSTQSYDLSGMVYQGNAWTFILLKPNNLNISF